MNVLYLIFIYPIELLIELVFQLTYQLTDDCGVSIAAVSLAVSFLSLPLYIIAERWQQKERDIQKVFKPEIDEIKAVFKGDEQYMILSTFYRQNHYHPIMALRSSISLMIQVPFFIAAYSYLSNLQMLKGESLWIFRDLGAPDALFSVGGFAVNVLPIAMTLVNVVASAVYVKGFAFKEKLQLYGMAALFLVLLYNSPAGLVLYWLLNNVFSLCKNICYKIKFKKPDLAFIESLKRPFMPLYEGDGTRFSIFALACASMFLLVGFVIPSSLVMSAVQEFSYIEPFKNPLGLLLFPLLQSLGIAVWCLALYFLFSRKTQVVLTAVMLAALLGALINTYIFTGSYGTVIVDKGLFFESGLKIKNELAKFPQDLLAFAAIVGAICFVLGNKRRLRAARSFCAVVVVSLAVFSLVNAVKINAEFSQIDRIMASEGGSRSADIEPVYHFSKTGKNVVVIMLDRAISSFFPEAMSKIPGGRENFSGFVFYPNTLAPGDHTILSAASLFGGYDYLPANMNLRSDMSQREKHNEALNVLPRYFTERGYKATVTDAPLANYSWIPDNSIFPKDICAVNLSSRYSEIWRKSHAMELTDYRLSDILKRNFLFFDFFRISPVSLRGILYKHGTWWSSNSDLGKDEFSTFIKWYAILDYLPELSDVVPDGNSYIAMENDTTHELVWMQPPEYTLKKEASDRGDNKFGSEYAFIHFHVNAAAMHLLGEWFAWMKENGVYDNTRIVVASDHGRKFENPLLDTDCDSSLVCRFNSLLLFKDFDAKGDLVTDRSFMSCADVPSLATKGLEAAPVNPFTKTPFDRNAKKDGFHLYSGPIEANNHKKNAFILTEEFIVKDDILKSKNWEKIR